MDHFHYQADEAGQQRLYAESVCLTSLAAEVSTPCYVYSRATLERHWQVFDSALGDHPHLICYAVKANSNLAVLDTLAKLGSGFDIVSGGELQRVQAINAKMSKVVFSGVGKSDAELEAAVQAGVGSINIESSSELKRLAAISARLKRTASISPRINPQVDPQTHPYIATGLSESKFGIALTEARPIIDEINALPYCELAGISCHIGSQITQLEPFLQAVDSLLCFVDEAQRQGTTIKQLNIGGGLGVTYTNESPPQPADYAQALFAKLKKRPDLRIIMEPGRAIAANAGILLTRVICIKHTPTKAFAIVDAGMNDLLRPALYHATHGVIPVIQAPHTQTPSQRYDIVGPICETGDFLAKEVDLPLQEGDLIAVRTAGAYGFSMSSNYNTRPRVAEVLVDGDQSHVVRQRESVQALLDLESVVPE